MRPQPSRRPAACRIIAPVIRVEHRGEFMARTGEPDLFETETQPDLFGAATAPAYRPDPDKVRSRLHKILAEARAARTFPWQPTRFALSHHFPADDELVAQG